MAPVVAASASARGCAALSGTTAPLIIRADHCRKPSRFVPAQSSFREAIDARLRRRGAVLVRAGRETGGAATIAGSPPATTRPFFAARGFARSLSLNSQKEWQEFCRSGKLPEDIPADPESAYKGKGWMGWSDWLGCDEDKAVAYENVDF